MLAYLEELVNHRELLRSWVSREIKVRYKQAVLGIGWAVLQPLAMMLIFTVVFSYFNKIPTEGIPYPIFSYSALLPWVFFSNSISFGTTSLVRNMNLVTKIYFPREILPFASLIASFIDFLVASVIFVFLMIYYKIALSTSLFWIPVILIVQVIFSLGILLLGSALNVFYRDIRFIIPLVLQIWLFLSPIIYPVSLVPNRYKTLYMLNPMASIIDSYRRSILFGKSPQLNFLLITTIVAIILFILSYRFFKIKEKVFADII